MPISTEQAKIVHDTWKKYVIPMPDYHKVMGVWLFQNLFDMDPQVKKLFHFAKDHEMTSDELWHSHRMVSHVKNVISEIEMAVEMFEPAQQQALIDNLRDLGKRHVARGVLQSNYDTFGDALLKLMASVIGAQNFHGDVKTSWEVFVKHVLDVIMEGAEYDSLGRGVGMAM
mmetsp:Transcript_17243/g.25661  ORF Transcript_17243/g.25661 Transcript_17243/m.25661 type:complete len:171 (+) Transcript_17243:239-751(+)